MEDDKKVTMDKIVNLCKSRGLVFQGSEIYGGMGNTWDYGPIGVEIKNNIKRAWWKRFVQENDNSFGLDAAILMNPRVWEASGHTASFSDPKMDCRNCKTRHRADNLIEDYNTKHNITNMIVDKMTDEEMYKYVMEKEIKCPDCGKCDWTEIKNFNLMFTTKRGVTEDNQDIIYLRPETAQGEFVNFLNVQRTTRAKIPFGIGQIGKAFRNEITPGNFIFRTIEFEQMEHQFFCNPVDADKFYLLYKQKAWDFAVSMGLAPEHLRFKDHDKLAHYAKAACDIQYLFPIGWNELNGIHNRTTYDLTRHQEYSGKSMMYTDPLTNEKYIPNDIEYSIGCDRLFLAVLSEAYDEEKLEDGDTRVVLHLKPYLAAYKVAILPLQKDMGDKAREIYRNITKFYPATYDEAGSIGKRYRRQDEIGTPYCVTIDSQTMVDNTVTIRDRDTMKQDRIKIEDLQKYLADKIAY